MPLKIQNYFVALLFFIMSPISLISQNTPEHELILSIERIWDRAAHNAFTSLIEFNGELYCSFRESSGHVSDINGSIRVIKSEDGQNWISVAHIFERGFDLRDPQLSITPDNRIMLNIGGSIYTNGKLHGMEPKVSFSDSNGRNFSDPQKVLIDEKIKSGKDWLWRATWNKDNCYATIYQPNKKKSVQLIKSTDGINYSFVSTFDVVGGNETTLRFFSDDKMVAVVRRDEERNGIIGVSEPPYKHWIWKELEARLGGPDLIALENGNLLCATREYPPDHNEKTILSKVNLDGTFTKLLTLPSGGDCSYPGLVMKDDILHISFYSSHEEKTAIYLAKIDALKYAYNGFERVTEPQVFYDQNGIVKLSCEQKNAEIKYTLDGSMPSVVNGYTYSEQINISKTTLLRAVSILNKYPESKILNQHVGTDIFQEAQKLDSKLKNGLLYKYYQGEIKSTLNLDKLVPIKVGVTPSIKTIQRIRDSNYGFFFEGFVRIIEDGVYTLYLTSNDGSRLYLNEELAIDNDGAHGKREESVVVSLRKGYHKIKLFYFQLGGSQELSFDWSGLKFGKMEIPESLLFH